MVLLSLKTEDLQRCNTFENGGEVMGSSGMVYETQG